MCQYSYDYSRKNSLLQMRSGLDQFSLIQFIIPEPLSLIYPLPHSSSASVPSGKEFNSSVLSDNTIFSPASGLGQSAGEKRRQRSNINNNTFFGHAKDTLNL